MTQQGVVQQQVVPQAPPNSVVEEVVQQVPNAVVTAPQEVPQPMNVTELHPVEPTVQEVDETRIFRAESGAVFNLSPINQMQLMEIQKNSEPPEPEIPVMVAMVHGVKQITPNDMHPGYLEQKKRYEKDLKDHKENAHIPLMEFCFTAGIEEGPDQEWIDQYSRFFPDPALWKYNWVMSQLTPAESAQLLNKIIGINMPTEEGVSESEEVF